jgi:CSLREA domain-containing protein
VIGALVLHSGWLAAATQEQQRQVNNFNVVSTDDTDDGACTARHCSLREAINAANLATGTSNINLLLDPGATIVLTGELPTIQKSVNIYGKGADQHTIDADSKGRHFNIDNADAGQINVTVDVSEIAQTSGCRCQNDRQSSAAATCRWRHRT